MTEFLKIDLEDSEQPAVVRLRDDAHLCYPSQITEAHFDCGGARIVRFNEEDKPKKFAFSTDEIENLVAAWTEYQARIMQHSVEVEERRKAIIAEAKALAKSVQFDMPDLNVQAKRDGNTWEVTVPAIGFERWSSTEDLKEAVQGALNRIKWDVAIAKDHNWNGVWADIIGSYERAMTAGQGEPEEIVEARKLLKEAGIENWSITPGSLIDGTWNFDGPFGREGEILMSDESPTQLLADIKEYLERKQSDIAMEEAAHELSAAIKEASANYVDPETIIAQARELLTNEGFTGWTLARGYPGTTIDNWGFVHGDEVVFVNHSAVEALSSIRTHMARIRASEKYSGVTPEPIETGN